MDTLVASQQPPQRIHADISDAERFTLTGNVRPSIVRATDQGEASGDLSLPLMTLHFAMSPAQKADLAQLLQRQQTRHSTQFHKWLSPEQYANRFGMNTKDIQKVVSWLESQGFSNVQAARGRTFVTFSGTAAQAQNAFHTSIHNYVTSDGATHYANAVAPELPNALNGMVEAIRGLHDFHMKPHARAHLTSSVTGNHFLVPDDWTTIYDVKSLYNSGLDGTGRSIAVVGQTALVNADISTFQTNAGLSVKLPTVITVSNPGGVQVKSGDLGESDLDLEWAGAIAKGATIIFVTSNDVSNSESYAIDNDVADVMSITYGNCESDAGAAEMTSLNSLFQQASAQGMSVVAASGDQGAADCDATTATSATLGLAVDVPGASPWVTAVGGTEFNEGSTTGGTQYWSATNDSSNGSALSYIPETAWNDSVSDNALSASGGGASTLNTKPTWQTGTGVPADGDRDVPDIAVSSSADHDGYLTCTETGTNTVYSPTCVVGFRVSSGGDFNVTGGTSAAAPSFAAIIAILDQKFNERQGLVNPNLYTLASISSNAFHDITTGNNIVPCNGGTPNCSSTVANVAGTLGYSAGVGYDQVTGWGSVDAYNMVEQWQDDYALSTSSSSLTVNPGSTGTATITVTPIGSFTGSVTFTCFVSTNITNTTCSVPGTVSNGSGQVTLTVTAGSTAHTPWWHRQPALPPASQRLMLFAIMSFFIASGVYIAVRQRKLQMAGLIFTVMTVVGLSSCGGSSSSSTTTTTTPPTPTPASVSGTVIVSATSGAITYSTSIALTIP